MVARTCTERAALNATTMVWAFFARSLTT